MLGTLVRVWTRITVRVVALGFGLEYGMLERPKLGIFDGLKITIDPAVDFEMQCFLVLHLFGHSVQWVAPSYRLRSSVSRTRILKSTLTPWSNTSATPRRHPVCRPVPGPQWPVTHVTHSCGQLQLPRTMLPPAPSTSTTSGWKPAAAPGLERLAPPILPRTGSAAASASEGVPPLLPASGQNRDDVAMHAASHCS